MNAFIDSISIEELEYALELKRGIITPVEMTEEEKSNEYYTNYLFENNILCKD